jgi:thioredoxin reductase
MLLETIGEIRKKVGRDYPLSVRISGTEYYPDGLMIEEAIEITREMEKATVDIVHVSGGAAFGPAGHQTVSPMSLPLGRHVWAAEAVRKAVHIPVIASGSITTPEFAEQVLEQGKGDFISLARSLVADPYWPQKAQEGRSEDIRPCIRCNDGCVERSDMLGRPPRCTVNVTASRDTQMPLIKAESKNKKVAVIGGGPGGLEAASICALRGYQVVLFEKRKLGGALIEASVPYFKADLRRLIGYYAAQMQKLKVEVVYQEADVSTIKGGNFDSVIVAVGADSVRPEIPGVDLPLVTDALKVLTENGCSGQRICVVGGGLIGVEVGLFLATQGKDIIFTTRQVTLMSNVGLFDQLAYQDLLKKYPVAIHTGRSLDSVIEGGLVLKDKNGELEKIAADKVVLASGFIPRTALRDELEKEPGLAVYAAGDCISPRKIFDAIHEGHLAARQI